MKQLTKLKAFALTAIALLAWTPGQGAAAAAVTLRADEHFSVREYNLFHDVLHPLQHEALPKKDFKTIRAQANALVARGRAIVRLGVPVGVQERTDFLQGLKRFEKALTKFKSDARKRSNARLEDSY